MHLIPVCYDLAKCTILTEGGPGWVSGAWEDSELLLASRFFVFIREKGISRHMVLAGKHEAPYWNIGWISAPAHTLIQAPLCATSTEIYSVFVHKPRCRSDQRWVSEVHPSRISHFLWTRRDRQDWRQQEANLLGPWAWGAGGNFMCLNGLQRKRRQAIELCFSSNSERSSFIIWVMGSQERTDLDHLSAMWPWGRWFDKVVKSQGFHVREAWFESKCYQLVVTQVTLASSLK